MDAAALEHKRMKARGAPWACPLPEEIVEDILARLPAKSLRRFECVSRSFRTTIVSRAFQDAHFLRRRNDRRLLFITPARGRQQDPAPFHYAWHPGTGVVERITRCRRLLPQGTTMFPISNKSCHGLVLLRSLDYHTHHVWNPCTGDVSAALPDRTPLGATWHASSSSTGPSLAVSYGLGYCSATRRHKAVRMYHAACGDDNNGGLIASAVVCEVFTLDDESAYWRPVATKPSCILNARENDCRQGAVFCNGNLHFLIQDDGGGVTVFNVTDETLTGTLELPPALRHCCRNLRLTELGGYLCAYVVEKERNSDYYIHVAVWLLRDYYAADGNWDKLIGCRFDWATMPAEAKRSGIKPSWIAPLDILDDGRKVMFGTGSCHVFTVDTNTGAQEMIFSPEDTVIGECRGDRQFPTMGFFEESLARPMSNAAWSPSMQAWSDVLSRLSARTVWGLDQVCRSWRAVIKSECFAAAHARHHADRDKSPQMMFLNGMPYGFEHFVDAPCAPPPLVCVDWRIVCSKPCHGLNAGSFGNCDFVCNPLIGYFKALPLDNSMDRKRISMYDFLYAVSSASFGFSGAAAAMFTGRLGLGYDQESSRHVLVRLAYKERNLVTREYKMACSMRYVQDMVWGEAEPPPRPIADVPPAHVKGKLYWMVDTELGQRSPSGHGEIVVLDATTRGFEVLPGPPFDREDGENVSLVELQGLLCVACSHRRMGIIKVWAMEEETAGVWSVKYDIELERFSPEYSPETTTPLAVDPRDGRILLSTGRAMGYYDPRTAELETICRLGKHMDNGMKFVPVLYEESLVKPCDPIF